MRHIMRGALGAVVVYPLIWHYWPSEAAVSATKVAGAAPASATDPSGAVAPSQPEPETAARAVTARLPVPALGEPAPLAEPRAPQPVPARAPTAPQPPSVPQPQDPLSAIGQVPELKETLARAAEIQQHAANPAELEKAVQSLDEDPAKIARLKALADMFVQLPPPRGDAYLPASGSSAAPAAPR